MHEIQMTNLDIRCAELGREIAQISGMEEKIINAALTVLVEQGPYAMFLYLQARHSNVAVRVSSRTLHFLRDVFPHRIHKADNNIHKADNNMLKAIKELSNDLDDLLFARDLLRNSLAYARYHLKARKGEEAPS